MTEPKILQLADFEALVGKQFTLSLEGCEQMVQAELTEAKPSKGDKAPDSGRDPFTLLFRLPPENQIAQATYTVEANEFPRTVIFLVPIDSKPDGYFMEAVFT